MAEYTRQKAIQPVCSNNEAREYFSNCGLTYRDINEGDILSLVLMLNQELKKSNKSRETSTGNMRLSEKIRTKKRPDGSIITCFLYMNSHYFTQRECISFNADGFIGFAGWADQGNTNPILRAFLRWCDELKEANP